MRDFTPKLAMFCCVALVGSLFLAAFRSDMSSERTGTELLKAGFTITDREGRQVERFDGQDYWTKESK